MKSKIVLNVYRPEKGMCGVVRLDEEAERLIRQLQRETGLSTSFRKLLSRDLTWLKSRRKKSNDRQA